MGKGLLARPAAEVAAGLDALAGCAGAVSPSQSTPQIWTKFQQDGPNRLGFRFNQGGEWLAAASECGKLACSLMELHIEASAVQLHGCGLLCRCVHNTVRAANMDGRPT